MKDKVKYRTFFQRFRNSTPKERFILILKFMGLFILHIIFSPTKSRNTNDPVYSVELGDHVTRDGKTGEVLSVRRGFYKDVNH